MPSTDPSPPLVTHIYTADPSAHVFNDTIYVYPSHDRETDIQFNDSGDQYDMVDYHVISLPSPPFNPDDLSSAPKAAIDHGVALSDTQVPWASKQLWAPDAAFNASTGKYHLFFPARDKSGRFKIGTAIGDNPGGPFTAEPEPIKGSYSIDPASFVDPNDGACYLYFGGIWGGELQCYPSVNDTSIFDSSQIGPKEPHGENVPALGPRVGRLTPDFLQFTPSGHSSDLVHELTILDPQTNAPILSTDHEKRFFEASWLHTHAGKYYFSYSTGDTHYICYAIGDNPLGPFTYRGRLLEPVVGWTSHHSIVEWRDRTWLFYHDCERSGGPHSSTYRPYGYVSTQSRRHWGWGVGTAFLSQVASLPSSIRPSLIFVSRSTKQLYKPDYSPVDPSSLQISDSKLLSLSDIVTYLTSSPNPVCVVDNTSNQDVADAYPSFLSKGISVITPNKKAFSSDLKLWTDIFAAAKAGKAFVYHESSVGAGLPVISSLNDLIRTGDTVTRIEGVFSGTMSFLFNTFAPTSGSSGGKWSKIVAEAKAAGYTEPDPRDDLNGMDVARKLTILARLAGLEVEGPASFPVKSLIPSDLLDVSSAEEFMQKLPEYDSEMESYKTNAEKEGKVVRYVGSIDAQGQKIKVALESVEKGSAIGGLKGSDNLICFYTKRYGANPLVIQGAGAGNDVTAMGVTSDLLKVLERTR